MAAPLACKLGTATNSVILIPHSFWKRSSRSVTEAKIGPGVDKCRDAGQVRAARCGCERELFRGWGFQFAALFFPQSARNDFSGTRGAA